MVDFASGEPAVAVAQSVILPADPVFIYRLIVVDRESHPIIFPVEVSMMRDAVSAKFLSVLSHFVTKTLPVSGIEIAVEGVASVGSFADKVAGRMQESTIAPATRIVLSFIMVI